MLDLEYIKKLQFDFPKLNFFSLKKKKVLIFCISPWWINYIILISKLIKFQCKEIIILYSLKSEFDNIKLDEYKEYYSDLQKYCKDINIKNKLYLSNIKFINIDEFEINKQYVYKDYKALGLYDAINFDKKISYIYDRNNFNVKSRIEIRKKYYNLFISFIRKYKPDVGFTNSGWWSLNGAFFDACKYENINASIIEANLRTYDKSKSLFLRWNYSPLAFNKEWVKQDWKNFKKNKIDRSDLYKENEFFLQKVKVPGGVAGAMQLDQPNPNLVNEIIKSKDKKFNILITTSYSSEGYKRSINKLFISQREWLSYTVKYILNNFKNIKIFIKLHPIAGDAKKKPTEDPLNLNISQDDIRSESFKLKKNYKSKIVILDVESGINFYDIVKKMHLLLTYTSMTAMEAPLFRVPVILPNTNQHFQGKNFTNDAISLSEYKKIISDFVMRKQKFTEDQFHNANEYFYFYHNILPLKFPYNVAMGNYGLVDKKAFNFLSLESILGGYFYSIFLFVNKKDELQKDLPEKLLSYFFKKINFNKALKDRNYAKTILGNLSSLKKNQIQIFSKNEINIFFDNFKMIEKILNKHNFKIEKEILKKLKII